MIHKVERIGSEDNAEGYFLINGSVQVRYVQVDDAVDMLIDYDSKLITELEAQELARELLDHSMRMAKDIDVSE